MAYIPIRLAKMVEEIASKGEQQISVFALVSMFGYERRARNVCDRIRRALEELKVETDPDFEFAGYWDTLKIRIQAEHEPIRYSAGEVDPSIRIGHLEAANVEEIGRKLVCASPDETVESAFTKMLINDYSQLPVVTTPTTLKGAISWQSIAQATRLGTKFEYVRECIEKPDVVTQEMFLFDAVERIVSRGYVLVRGIDGRITGIVTVADIGVQFLQLGEPFILLGEIENHLRILISGKFSAGELQAAGDPNDTERTIVEVSDMTFGEYKRLLEVPDNWDRLKLGLDRAGFIEQLEAVREIRNDIMHFSPDPPADGDLERVRKLVAVLRKIRAIRVEN